MKNILLVAPSSLEPQYFAIEKVSFLGVKTFMPPLHLATVAALTPDDVEVDIWDEAVQGTIGDETEMKDYDLVGVTGISPHIRRIREVAQMFRSRGVPVVIGGAAASATPKLLREFADVLFVGEAELTWPQFIADWKAGSYQREYRQIAKPDLSITPLPRWDSIADQMGSYITGCVQTTRGCPFDCEFCDVIYLFGRRSRRKPIDNVLAEVAAFERLGTDRVWICDDNFIGSPRYTKELLRELISMNNSFENPLIFSGQLSINVAQDEELLELLADANFSILFIGIETPNEESLKEANKLHNLRRDLLADCIKVQSYGLPIKSGTMVGFDHDSTDIFDRQFEFLQEACIPLANPSLLRAEAGTRLWRRALRERRLLRTDVEGLHVNREASNNIIPKGMTRTELLSGYADMFERIYDWDNCVARLKGFISGIKRQPQVRERRPKQRLKRLFQLIRFLFAIDKDSRRAITKIVSHTRRHAPFMMDKVLGLIVHQYAFVYRSRLVRKDVQKQLKIEEKVDIDQYIDFSDLLIPERFDGIYEEIFSEVYDRVYDGINDKTRVDEALTETLTDFLTRWGQTLDEFSDQHRFFLHQLADRAVSKANSESREPSSALAGREQTAPVIRGEMAAEVWKAVEKELRG